MQQRAIVQDGWKLTLGKGLVGRMGAEGCEAGVMGY